VKGSWPEMDSEVITLTAESDVLVRRQHGDGRVRYHERSALPRYLRTSLSMSGVVRVMWFPTEGTFGDVVGPKGQ
jgi:hypothetical protein